MRLIYNNLSPFSRKVRVLLHELQLNAGVEFVNVAVSPVQPNEEVAAFNPLMKVPTLIRADGEPLFDSRVICDYLDTNHAGGKLGMIGPDRFAVARAHALADGVLEAGILCLFEQRLRPEGARSEAWQAGQTRKVLQGLDGLNKEQAVLSAPLNLAQIAIATTVAWLQFRSIVPDVLGGRDALARFQAGFAERPSMLETAPS